MRVQVNLSDELVERVDNYCNRIGIARSAMISVMVGQYMDQLEKADNVLTNAYNDVTSNLKGLMND